MYTDDASFESKLEGAISMIKSGLSVLDALHTENILGLWVYEKKDRYEGIISAGESMGLSHFEPLWKLLQGKGIVLTQEQKLALYEDFWNN